MLQLSLLRPSSLLCSGAMLSPSLSTLAITCPQLHLMVASLTLPGRVTVSPVPVPDVAPLLPSPPEHNSLPDPLADAPVDPLPCSNAFAPHNMPPPPSPTSSDKLDLLGHSDDEALSAIVAGIEDVYLGHHPDYLTYNKVLAPCPLCA